MLHIQEYLDYLKFEKRFSEHTICAYKTDLEQFSLFISLNYQCTHPQDVSHRFVRNWIVALMEEKITPRSVNRKLSALKSFYKYLLRQGLLKVSPMDKVVAPKTKKRLPVFVEEKQMNTLIDIVEFEDSFIGIRNKLIIEMFYYTGMRLSELIGLKIQDIELGNLTIRVLGKRNKERLIPITSHFTERLNEYLHQRSLQAGNDNHWLFISEKGNKMYPIAIYRIINGYLKLVTSIEKKSPHVLRHTFATHMLNNGADLNAIKELLGHANLAATQVYTHNTFEKLKRVYKLSHPRA